MDKCQNCKRKSHILIECKCASKYCLKCKQPELHMCTFDFKLNAQFTLALNNPVVKSKKVETI